MEPAEKDKGWLGLYREAILEHNPEMLMTRLGLAHKAIQNRARELWYQRSPEMSEREHLTAASHYLEILRSLVEKKERAA